MFTFFKYTVSQICANIDFTGFSSPCQPARITSPIVLVNGNALKLQAVKCGRWEPKYADGKRHSSIGNLVMVKCGGDLGCDF